MVLNKKYWIMMVVEIRVQMMGIRVVLECESRSNPSVMTQKGKLSGL